jgi:UTP-glucose-1-phosphate uridylyltransferase
MKRKAEKRNMNTTLIIMAAGIGSRFGEGIKQLAQMGPNGEIIMDYSIHDAKEAGFNKVVFIIRKDIFKEFEEIIGNRIKEQIDVEYVFQELDDLPEGFEVPEGRTKPWGTGQAVLCCKDVVKEPFVIINADDYYGKEAFVKIHEFLINNYTPERSKELCMAGFILGNTLSDNGTVTRGICAVDENDYLTDVMETYEIKKTEDGAESQGNKINVNSHVSMNMWGLTPEFVGLLEEGFVEFFENIKGDEAKKLKGEYLLPIYIDELLKKGKVSVKLLETQDKWFGVTYKEDKPVVVESFAKLIADGVYRKDLFSDLQA